MYQSSLIISLISSMLANSNFSRLLYDEPMGKRLRSKSVDAMTDLLSKVSWALSF